MEKLTTIVSRAIPLPLENMDTDRIIPARFLKATTRNGLGEQLFCDLRFDKQNNKIPGFVLNNTVYSGSILLAGKNFGCGSSREHAAWALKDYGFRIIVSEYFADIFRNNALNNGLLPVELSSQELKKVFQLCYDCPETLFEIDLEKQLFTTPYFGFEARFQVAQWKKQCLLNGWDDMDYLLSRKEDIIRYESTSLYNRLIEETTW